MFIKYIISAVVFLSFFVANAVFAQGANSILSTSVRKTSSNGLNVTFFTKGENAQAPIVKDKGNNQYVILLPDLTDSTGGRPDFRTASDLVEDVHVKTINEGAVTYTKVTLTTKRPVTVKAETRRTTQSVGELAGVSDIVSKVNLINQDIAASKNIQPVNTVNNSTQTAVAQPALPKMNSVQDILNNKNLIGQQKREPVKPAVAVTPAPKADSLAAHVPSNTGAIKNNTKKLQNENIKHIKNEAVKNIDKVEKNIKTAEEHNILVNEEEPEVTLPPLNSEAEKAETVKEIVPAKSFDFSKIISSPVLLISIFLFGALIIALFIMNKVKAAIKDTAELNGSFIERMNNAVPSTKKDYSEIAQNQNLNWQEKYASFKDEKAQEQKKVLDTRITSEPDEDLDIVEDYVEPEPDADMEVVPLMKDTPNPFASNYQDVHNSADVITQSMKRSLTGFDEERNLHITRRNTGLQHRLKAFDSNPVLARNMSELLDTIIQMDEEKGVSPAPQPVQTASVPQITPRTPDVAREVKANATSPIETIQKAPVKKKMKIKESRAIDENRGFYLVDMEDKLALMGRVNDKFTVLKKFDDKEKKTLQVRRDKDNLYMVRTDGFKALVDVEGSRMGVFAEL